MNNSPVALSFVLIYVYSRDSQVALLVKNSPANTADIRYTGSIPGSGGSPGERHGTPVFLPGEYHGQSLVGYGPCDCKELDTTEAT